MWAKRLFYLFRALWAHARRWRAVQPSIMSSTGLGGDRPQCAIKKTAALAGRYASICEAARRERDEIGVRALALRSNGKEMANIPAFPLSTVKSWLAYACLSEISGIAAFSTHVPKPRRPRIIIGGNRRRDR